jgi:hypothetical protein
MMTKLTRHINTGRADETYGCGYEDAVLRGLGARVRGKDRTAPTALSQCCASLGDAKIALDAVDEVTWGFTPNWSIQSITAAPNENVTSYEPYTFDPAVVHRVLDGVARAIESVTQACQH